MHKARKDDKGRALHKGESQRKDKRYCYSYTDMFGKRKYVYANDIVELRNKEKMLVRDQMDGLDTYAAGNATLNFLFDRYIKTKTNIRPTTLANYKYMYNHFVRSTLGQVKLKDIRYSDMVYFYNSLIDDKGLNVRTLDSIHSTLHPAFTMAVRDNLIRTNPSDGALTTVKKRTDVKKNIRHALTLEQQRHFINYVKECPLLEGWETIFTVLLGTGLRVGEFIGLRWEDIDFENKMISINHSLVYYTTERGVGRKSELHASLPKTEAGIRNVPMMPQVYEALKQEYKKQKKLKRKTEVVDGLTNFVFVDDDGLVILPSRINDAIKRAIHYHNMEETEKAKEEKREPVLIPDFSCHHLRHTFCTRFCENETNVKVIQAVMGHADIETTMNIYAEATDSKKAEAMSKLAESIDVF